MNIEEAREMKKHIEHQITLMIRDFQKETGCEISSISISEIQHVDMEYIKFAVLNVGL